MPPEPIDGLDASQAAMPALGGHLQGPTPMPRILLVEDNDDNWDMLSRRLKRRGYEVSRAVDGREAVEMAMGSAPDVILMDVNLPVMGGLEATRLIRASANGSIVPIIALSAHALT